MPSAYCVADHVLSSLNTSTHFIPATLGGSYYKCFNFADGKRLLSCFSSELSSLLPPVCSPFAQQQLLDPWQTARGQGSNAPGYPWAFGAWNQQTLGSQSFYSLSLVTVKSDVSSFPWWRSLLHFASLVSLLHLSHRLLLSFAVGCEGGHHHGLSVVKTQAD